METRQEEFDRLLRTHARLVSSAIRRVCSRRYGALAPDIEQEVYVALWKRLESGKEITHPISYLYKVALTTALSVIRKHLPAAEAPAGESENVPAHTGAFLGLVPAEQGRFLSEALASLPAEESRAVRAYLAGFNHEELAGLYGWSPSVARHRIYRGLEKVRRMMAAEAR